MNSVAAVIVVMAYFHEYQASEKYKEMVLKASGRVDGGS